MEKQKIKTETPERPINRIKSVKDFCLELITCGKTNTLSSMRFINVIGSIILLFCIVCTVLSKTESKELVVMYLTGGLLGLNGGKVIQSKFEKD